MVPGCQSDFSVPPPTTQRLGQDKTNGARLGKRTELSHAQDSFCRQITGMELRLRALNSMENNIQSFFFETYNRESSNFGSKIRHGFDYSRTMLQARPQTVATKGGGTRVPFA
jgi:hypothetical protein